MGGDGKEYWADGKNWGTVTQEDAGRWRIELSPRNPALSDNFLNVIQVMDAQPAPKPFPISKSYASKGEFVAVSISNRIVAQQLSLDRTKNEIEFAIGNAGKDYDVLVTDLKSGSWLVGSASGNIRVTVSEDSGTAYFKSKGGMFTLKFEN